MSDADRKVIDREICEACRRSVPEGACSHLAPLHTAVDRAAGASSSEGAQDEARAGVSDPYREAGHAESDDAKVARLRLEYDCIAVSAMTTPEANAAARARMREIASILRAMGRWT